MHCDHHRRVLRTVITAVLRTVITTEVLRTVITAVLRTVIATVVLCTAESRVVVFCSLRTWMRWRRCKWWNASWS